MIISDVLDLLERGLKESADLIFDFSETPYDDIKPEYLKTVKISEIFNIGINNSKIRLEKKTRDIILASLFPPRPPGFSACIARNGRIDITVSYEKNGWLWPIILIENKIYVNNFHGIDADVIRCLEFIDASAKNSKMSIESTCVTFLIKIEKGVTEADHDRLANIVYQQIITSANSCKSSYSTSIIMHDKKVILRRGGYPSLIDATHVNEHGETNISANGVDPSIYGCFIVFEIQGKNSFLNKLQKN